MLTYLCAAQGVETRVLDAGSGPAVVFVHGLAARADRWRHNLEPIAASGFRCLAIDLPGHGFADKGAQFPFSVPRCASWLTAVLDELGVERFSLVGTSLGGFISGQLVCENPARVNALALVGTIGMTPLGPDARASISSRFSTVTREGIERKLNTVLVDKNLVTPAWIEEEWRINNSQGAAASFAVIADYLKERIDDDVVGERLAGLERRPPIALLWGARDLAVPIEVAHRAREILRPELYAELPDTGHGPYLENPSLFNSLLTDFLRRSG